MLKTTVPYSKFEDIKISTKTIVVTTNIDIHIEPVFNTFPVHAMEIPHYLKSKKLVKAFIAEHQLPDGTIISMEYEGHTRGIPIKHFRNAMTVVMIIDNKCINFKLPLRGRIQITGCKTDSYAEKCIHYLWQYLQEYSTTEQPLFTFVTGATQMSAILRTVMTNKNFNLGFFVNREQLDRYINMKRGSGRSLLETTFGYTGVNIKYPYTHKNNLFKCITFSPLLGWTTSYIEYNDYLKMLNVKDYSTEVSKKRYNSFMIFHSGAAIMSGMDTEHMESDYYAFMELIQESKGIVEDKLVR